MQMITSRPSPSSFIFSSSRHHQLGWGQIINIKASNEEDRVHVKTQKINHLPYCSCCFRRRSPFLDSLPPLNAFRPSDSDSVSEGVSIKPRSLRPDWYQESFAWFMKTCLKSYEAELAGYKSKLFDNLEGKAEKVLEIGIGTGPNLKYYAKGQDLSVIGVDPNTKMEKYARESAAEAGLRPENFRFIQSVGEAMPLDDASVDVAIGTLVMCSVSDVAQTLNEIKRVLKPGGLYIFLEHVAAEDGTFLKFAQNLLDPLQQLVVDGCHLRRHTGKYISEAEFHGGVEMSTAFVQSIPWISRHVYGVAYK